jgi:hypothetical protein
MGKITGTRRPRDARAAPDRSSVRTIFVLYPIRGEALPSKIFRTAIVVATVAAVTVTTSSVAAAWPSLFPFH